MPKRCPKRTAKTTDAAARLRKVLTKETKRELIDALVLAADSVGFVCDDELKALHHQFEAPP